MDINKYIINIKDFPKKGIEFKDITPIFNNPKIFNYVINTFSDYVIKSKATVIISPEARGFLLGSAIAYKTKTRLVLARKSNKLPREVIKIKFKCEYSKRELQLHKDDILKNDKVVIIDDVLATGETTLALINLIENQLSAKVIKLLFLLNIKELNGLQKLKNYEYNILI